MNKTNVDELLIEMITPKVKEIETRFSNGEGLSSEDVNTFSRSHAPRGNA